MAFGIITARLYFAVARHLSDADSGIGGRVPSVNLPCPEIGLNGVGRRQCIGAAIDRWSGVGISIGRDEAVGYLGIGVNASIEMEHVTVVRRAGIGRGAVAGATGGEDEGECERQVAHGQSFFMALPQVGQRIGGSGAG